LSADDFPASTSDGPAGTDGAPGTSSVQKELEHPEDEADAKAMRQRLRKRETAKRLYRLRQQRISDLEAEVEQGAKRNVELQGNLTDLLSELESLQKREAELVDAQKLAREDIKALKRQKQALEAS
jgi:predicted RNase H-like nuclease (RuvC/YqgF family)